MSRTEDADDSDEDYVAEDAEEKDVVRTEEVDLNEARGAEVVEFSDSDSENSEEEGEREDAHEIGDLEKPDLDGSMPVAHTDVVNMNLGAAIGAVGSDAALTAKDVRQASYHSIRLI